MQGGNVAQVALLKIIISGWGIQFYLNKFTTIEGQIFHFLKLIHQTVSFL